MNIKHLMLTACIALSACTPASKHAEQVRGDDSNRITVGKVQREIKVGMSSAEVIEVLGSPNIVTTDDKRREQWVYDKISTETVYSKTAGGVNVLILGYGKSTGAQSTTQRTLTIIIKFDSNSKVRDFAYHNSSF